MKNRIFLAGMAASIALASYAGTLKRDMVTTSQFTREALTNESATSWRNKLGVSTNGIANGPIDGTNVTGGNLVDLNANSTIDWYNSILYTSGAISLDWENKVFGPGWTFTGAGNGLTNLSGTNIVGFGTNVFTGTSLGAKWQGGSRLGFGTYLITDNGTNVYCNASAELILRYCTNMIRDGMHKAGYNWIWIDEGYQQGTTFGTINTNLYPMGMTNFCAQAHAIGFNVAVYSDLSYLTCCGLWGCGGTNIAAAAAMFNSWGVDHLRLDTCNYSTLGGTWSEQRRRDQYESMAYELRKLKSKITIEMHMNATPYAPWIGENMNAWQVAPNGDGGVWWAQLKAIDQAALGASQFRPGFAPKIAFGDPIMMSSNVNTLAGWTNTDGTAMNYNQGYYGRPLLGCALAAMWHSDAQLPGDTLFEEERWINAGFPTQTWGGLMVTNKYLLRMWHDTVWEAPHKVRTNGTVEAWATKWDDNRTFLMLVNRGYNGTHYYTNGYDGSTEIGIPWTATNIVFNSTDFGARTNEVVTFTEILYDSPTYTTTNITFSMPTNSCKVYIVSAASAKQYVGDGSLLTGIAPGTQTPWASPIDGASKPLTGVQTIGFVTEMTNQVIKLGDLGSGYGGLALGGNALSFGNANFAGNGSSTIVNGPSGSQISFKQGNVERFIINSIGDLESRGAFGGTNFSYLTVTGRVVSASQTNSGNIQTATLNATGIISGIGSGLTALNGTQVTSGTVPPAQLGSGSSIGTKFLRGDSTWQTIAGGGDALVANPLSQFAATTSSQLGGVLSDESGSGVFPMFTLSSLTAGDGVKWSGSAWTNGVIAGGGSQTPLTADVNGAGKSIINLNNVTLTNTLSAGTVYATNFNVGTLPGTGPFLANSNGVVVFTNVPAGGAGDAVLANNQTWKGVNTYSNNILIDATHTLSLSNVSSSPKALMIRTDNTVTNVGGTGVLLGTGSAAASSDVQTLFPGIIHTNGMSVSAQFSNNITLSALAFLYPSNLTTSKVLMFTTANGVTNVGGTGILLGTGLTAASSDVQALFPGTIMTNGMSVAAQFSNNVSLSALAFLYPSNLLNGQLLTFTTANGVTNTGLGAVPIDGNGAATTSGQVNALFPGSIVTNNNSFAVVFSNSVTMDASHSLSLSNVGASKAFVNDAGSIAQGVSVTGSGNVMRTRTGVIRSWEIPAFAWGTNGTLSPATQGTWTNTADIVWTFADAVTNEVRLRCGLPGTWDAGAVRFQFTCGNTLTNTATTAIGTNAVFDVQAGVISSGVDEGNLTLGSAVLVTNRLSKTNMWSAQCTTPDITVQGAAVNKDIIFVIRRRTNDGGDATTNAVSMIHTRLLFTESTTEPTMPAATN